MTKKSFDGWIDGTPMTYSNWAVDQPTTRNNRQRCGEIYTGEEHGRGWHDNWCDHPNEAVGSRTVCEKEWTSYGGHQYMLIDSLDTWDNQRSVCEQLGAHMVTINDPSEDAFVQSMMPDTGDRKEWLWIGMTKKSFDGWIDGTPMTYSNWAVDQPTTRNNRQRCGEIYTGEEHGMGWHDNWCDHPNGALGSRTVCEKVPM